MVAFTSDSTFAVQNITLEELKVEEARSNEEPERDEESIRNLKDEFCIIHTISPYLNQVVTDEEHLDCRNLREIINYPLKIYRQVGDSQLPFGMEY